MTSVQADVVEEKLQIPLDLSQWFDKTTLLSWMNEELETLDWANPELLACLRTHPAYQPRIWLGLLTFAYATGTFESEEIVRLCYTDEIFRCLCTGPIPLASELGRFRRDNRGLLRWLLLQTLKRALKEKFGLGGAFLPAGLRHFLTETAGSRLDIARHVDRAAQGA